MGFITWRLRKIYKSEGKTSIVNDADLDLPERFCQFAILHGNYLYPYFKGNGKNDPMMTYIHNLIEHYPTWESVKNSKEWIENDGDKSEWDEIKHNLFKECLEWCEEQGGFWGQWLY